MNAARRFRLGSDHATPWPWRVEPVEPVLAACPIPTAGVPSQAAIRELYRIAYERAVSATGRGRSRYESALSYSLN